MSNDVRVFILDVLRHWKVWIGGTVIAAILAVYQAAGGAVWTWLIWVWALTGIFIAAFLAWRDQRIVAQDALEKLRPKLRIACHGDIDGCVKPAIWREGPVKFFRVKVEPDCIEAVYDCKGQLTRIERDGKIQWSGDKALLTFAPGEDEDATCKTICDKVPEYLDVLGVTHVGVLRAATKTREWPHVPPLEIIFEDFGEYVLTVKISGKAIPTAEAVLKFNWTGNPETSALSLI